ncbi:ClpA/ClpB-like protein [Streptomyces sp. Ag109_O5-1]|uniref:Clp protease N-terminal domain-containing protein n=1 Tax=Streptomyces sp. Ag109_O5-1 TaxID=1938851 RepID=UPI000F4E543B|nr:Clp protease N-terminal domain-containing protein [Streptomyces sp. Ag109_O5-1]RPE40816.1 ClpA/ClpB-like protein [Streptomyces sp. Ag109_O5-1]
MYERFGERAQGVVETARDVARRLRHWYVEPGHVLLALLELDEEDTVRMLGAPAEALRGGVIGALGRGTVAPGDHLPLTGETVAVFELAPREADRFGDRTVEPFHVLLALLSAGNTLVMDVVAAHRVAPGRVLRPATGSPAPTPADSGSRDPATAPAHDPYVWAMS